VAGEDVMVLQRAFVWSVLPVVCIASLNGVGKRARTLLWIHIFIVLSLAMAYAYARVTYGRNLADPPIDALAAIGGERVFDHRGCRVLCYEPRKPAVRRLLVFPGLRVGVRRMMLEPCMAMFLEDSQIVCFQVQGIGDSDRMVDLSSSSMLDDALGMLPLFDELTDTRLPSEFVGYSLGTFVCMQLLANAWRVPSVREPRRAILVGAMFDGALLPADFKVLSLALEISNESLVSASRVPLYIIHARDDKLIPVDEAMQLYAACQRVRRRAEIVVCEGSHGAYRLDARTKVALARGEGDGSAV